MSSHHSSDVVGHNSSTRQPGDYTTAGTWAFVPTPQDPSSLSEAREHTLLQGRGEVLDRDPISLREEESSACSGGWYSSAAPDKYPSDRTVTPKLPLIYIFFNRGELACTCLCVRMSVGASHYRLIVRLYFRVILCLSPLNSLLIL